ncbi:MAG: hypothetical protein AB7H90_23100 [Alphaproteobacteria bacterium]
MEQAALRGLSKSEQRGKADRVRAILPTLEGRHAGVILNDNARHDGGWTLPRLSAEMACATTAPKGELPDPRVKPVG